MAKQRIDAPAIDPNEEYQVPYGANDQGNGLGCSDMGNSSGDGSGRPQDSRGAPNLTEILQHAIKNFNTDMAKQLLEKIEIYRQMGGEIDLQAKNLMDELYKMV